MTTEILLKQGVAARLQAIKTDARAFRAASIGAVDEAARKVELAFSSEAEVERWYGVEILDHSSGAVVLSRIVDGAPLLLDHDSRRQLGVVESVSIDADRRGRAVVRFGRSALADEIFNDIKDGIRKHVSVGYLVHDAKCIEARDDDTYVWLATKWEPFEISIVAVPADHSVGVGRSLYDSKSTQSVQSIPPERKAPMTTNIDNQLNVAPVIDAAKERLQATEQERERVRSIMAIAEQFKDSELANAFVKDGKSVGEYQRSLLDNIHNKQQRQSSHLSDKNGSADLGLSDKEARQFSFVKVLRALAEPTDSSAQRAAAFEFEVSEAAKQSMGKTTERILVPNEVLTRALNAGIDGGAAGNTGGKSIATSLLASSFIDILRNRSTILQVATSLTGLVGNIDIPRQSATSSGGWIGEDVDAPESNLELGQINLTPKTAASHSQITRKLINQSSLDVEALVRDDLAKSLALLIDKAAYYGSGAAGVPRGIANTAGINAVAFAGVNPTFAELVQMETVIAQANADVESMYYVLNPVQRGNAKTATKIPGINGSAIIWEAGNTINGYQSLVSNQINAGDVFFGNFADLLIGMWGGLELHVDPYSQSQKGRIRVTIFQDIDFAVRRTQSFCLGKKV